jgi:hypothetical protein
VIEKLVVETWKVLYKYSQGNDLNIMKAVWGYVRGLELPTTAPDGTRCIIGFVYDCQGVHENTHIKDFELFVYKVYV